MASELIQRFTFGNFTPVSPIAPEYDFFYGIPNRQRQLVALARTAIETQKASARLIAEGCGSFAFTAKY